MDRDTILKQIERYEKLLAAARDEAEEDQYSSFLKKNTPSLKKRIGELASPNNGAHEHPGKGSLPQCMIPKKPVLGLDPRMDAGFPPARSLSWRCLLYFDVSAGEGRSKKIMRKNELKRNSEST